MSRDPQRKNDGFAESLDLQYPLVGDPSGAICSAWGTKTPLIGLARRISFLVDRDGTISDSHKGIGVTEHIRMAKRAIDGD